MREKPFTKMRIRMIAKLKEFVVIRTTEKPSSNNAYM
jgi:hypothetical protein